MKPEEVFKRYDIRGKYPEEINEEFAVRLGRSLGTFISNNFAEKAVVCRDNKDSSTPLKKRLMEGLMSAGLEVVDVGVGPTDYAAWCGNKESCVSVQVTSSHMPLNFNGFKFMYPEGNGFVNEDLYTVQDLFRDEEFVELEEELKEKKELLNEYKKELISFSSDIAEDFDKKVVFQSMGGTGRVLPELMEELGLEVVDISEEKTPYMDPPNPKPDNLEKLVQKVEEENAEIGIANDLDADRITVYYKDRFLSGDEIFGILAQLVEGDIVASIDTSQALEEFAEVDYTRVGDPFVMDKALDIDAELAGEPNGHYSFTEFVPYNSGILTALILTGLDIEERLEALPEYFIERESIETGSRHELIKFLNSDIEDEKLISDLDGVKFEEGNAAVLVRPSGSSPKVRVISEAKTEKDAKKGLEATKDRINQF